MKFKAEIHIIGVNPFVFVPEKILQKLFKLVKKDKGPIPVKGSVNGSVYKQTLVKYSGEWRLYINTKMLKNSPKRIGEKVELTVAFDPEKREIKAPAQFIKALNADEEAKRTFNKLPPSRKREIIRYLANLRSKESLERNITRSINFLRGRERFVGRVKP